MNMKKPSEEVVEEFLRLGIPNLRKREGSFIFDRNTRLEESKQPGDVSLPR